MSDRRAEVLERLKFAAMTTFSRQMMDNAEVDIVGDFISDQLCARLAVIVYGKKGPTAVEERSYVEAAFPRLVPRWLRRRWTRERTFRLDATPMLLFPDATFVPSDKFGPARFYVDKYMREVSDPETDA